MKYVMLPRNKKGCPAPTHPNPPITCATCQCIRVHAYVGTGEIERRDVVFHVYGSGGLIDNKLVSGVQIGEIYQCRECGTMRMFGSSDRLFINASKGYEPKKHYKARSKTAGNCSVVAQDASRA